MFLFEIGDNTIANSLAEFFNETVLILVFTNK